jgi:uncharacterized membrane protein HdeD (DUF308 family)
MTTLIIRIIGGIFIFSGLMPALNYWMPSSSQQSAIRPFFPVVGVGSILFGLLLLLMPSTFVTLLMYLLGFLLILGGSSQLTSLISSRSVAPLRWWVFVWPVILLAAGFFILVKPMKSASLPFLILGIACLGYGVSDLFYALRLLYYQHKKNKEYVKFEEIEEVEEVTEEEA